MWFFHPQQTALWTHCDPTSPDHGEATQANIMMRLAFKKDPHLWLCWQEGKGETGIRK